ncbi:hypothetical protein B0H13DRAFT_2314230 [Mycena leptocephala]|nr:hypothetical protein B0H13DRAFT_2314230 [Mycena leptocephala]
MDGSSRQTQSRRTKLLDDLDGQYRNAKRARFNHTVARLLDDLDSDADAVSLESSEDRSDSEPDSDASASFSDLEDNYLATREQMILDLMAEIETTRVFDPMPRIPKASQLHLLDEWRELNHPNFREKFRVDPEIFDGLHELIKDQSHYGNGASPEETAEWAGVAVGTVVNCTNRVMVAVLSLHDHAIRYPTSDEKETTKAWVEQETCPEWRDGWMMADGTKFPLFERPGLHGDAWFDKNKDY